MTIARVEPSGWRWAVALAAVLALALAWLFAITRDGMPVALPDVPEGRVACLSYTPRDFVPGPGARVLRAQIEADLALLAAETRCVRTYSSTQGMAAVPEIAREHGLTVLLGVWIGRDAENNQAEIDAALAAAAAHPDVIEAIVVGNEVLLRHEQSLDSLRDYIAAVHAATDEPVTYADVWEFWRSGAALADAVDFVTIHILPYWENEPVGVAAALAHVREIHAEMHGEFPGKRLMIGETGWPSRGRQREGAVPGLVESARFVREFIAWADAEGLEYNLIEAFDQPWKRGSEGTVGGYWGLFGVDGLPKFPLTGPVTEDPHWRLGLALAGLLAVLGVLGGRLTGTARHWRADLWLAATGLAAGAVLYAQWRYVPAANRDAVEWAQTFAALACGWLLTIGLAARLAQTFTGGGTRPGDALVGGVEALNWNRSAAPRVGAISRSRSGLLASEQAIASYEVNPASGDGRETPGSPPSDEPTPATRGLSVLRLLLLFGMAYVCLGLALDPRYRDFPLAITALPALLLVIRQVLARGCDRLGIEERTLAAIIGVCALASLVIEGPANLRALAWNGSCLLLAGTLLLAGRREPRQHQGGEQDAGARRIEAIQDAAEYAGDQRQPG